MQRRDALQSFGSLATTAGLALLAGCSGSDDRDNRSPVDVESFDYRKGESGALLVVATVVNDGDDSAHATLRIQVEVGETAYRESREVTVPGGESKTLETEFQVTFERFIEGGGSIRPTVR